MWQQLHDISEDAKQQGLESANQHEFNALVDQLEKDYEQHGTRRPTPFETKALFLCNHRCGYFRIGIILCNFKIFFFDAIDID